MSNPHDRTSRYDSLVVMNRLHDQERIDLGAIPGVWQIATVAEKKMSDAELYLFAATHLYPHTQKKSVRTLALEFSCTEKTIQSYIESAKRKLLEGLKEVESSFLRHPVLRVRVYPLTDGRDSALPNAPAATAYGRDAIDNETLHRMASILFDAETYFAVSSYYLASAEQRFPAPQIAQALELSRSGAYQKIYEARNVMKQACSYQRDAQRLLAHPMFTGDDPHYAGRRVSTREQDANLKFSSRSARALFLEAADMTPHHMIPLLRSHFYDAASKHPLEKIAHDLRLSLTSVEQYVLRGRDELRQRITAKHPLLADHPLLRQNRVYQTESEVRQSFDYLPVPKMGQVSDEDWKNMEWANLLLNKRQYHVFAWALGVPKGQMKKAFSDNVELNRWITYSAVIKSVQTVREMCRKAEEIEQRFVAAGPLSPVSSMVAALGG